MLGDKPAFVIIDNLKGQVTTKINDLLEANNIFVCLLLPNTTDTLQPMDISVNKPAKDYLERRFEQWYSDEVMEQLTGETDIESIEIEPIDLRLAAVKEMTAKWLVDMAKYISDNPHIIVSVLESQEPSMDSMQSLRHIMNCLRVKSYQMMMILRVRQILKNTCPPTVINNNYYFCNSIISVTLYEAA